MATDPTRFYALLPAPDVVHLEANVNAHGDVEGPLPTVLSALGAMHAR
ncbi:MULTISPECIES: hypothetical protein [Cupriavidus]